MFECTNNFFRCDKKSKDEHDVFVDNYLMFEMFSLHYFSLFTSFESRNHTHSITHSAIQLFVPLIFNSYSISYIGGSTAYTMFDGDFRSRRR
jgi:hypothetical protein